MTGNGNDAILFWNLPKNSWNHIKSNIILGGFGLYGATVGRPASKFFLFMRKNGEEVEEEFFLSTFAEVWKIERVWWVDWQIAIN